MECPFDLTNKKQVIEFEEEDPYNKGNILKGYVNRRQGHLYGALWITHVNGKECPQLIYSAPKQHYPFDKSIKDEKVYKFPEYDEVQLYEKLDGTCIISHNYTDIEDNTYLTYKTRLRPFLGSGKYGNFFQLWNEMRDKYPEIDKMCKHDWFNHVFEMYGKRNKILIDYDIPLDTKLIFVINSDNGHIYPPSLHEYPYGVPILSGWSEDLTDEETDYLNWQNRLENSLEIDEENKIMKGKEGLVWYFMKDSHAVQIKCKPPSVLKYHWSGDALPFESVYTTVINAFENFDEPTYDDVVSLLLEEFEQDKIEKSRVRIEKVLGRILFDRKYQHKLAEDYRRMGFDINKDKVTCMRWFGKNYPKSEAKRIFRLLKQYEEE